MTAQRVRAAFRAYPAVMRRLSGLVPKWTDQFLELVVTDSGLEALSFYRYLACKPRPVQTRLVSLGFRWHPVVHPDVDRYGRVIIEDQRFAGLVVDDMLLVFQVPVLANEQIYILDVLVKFRGRWFDLEIDGPAHNPRRDADRARDLRIPIMRVKEPDVVADDYVDRVRMLLIKECER